MNFPIQSEHLDIEMLRGVYQFADEESYQWFIGYRENDSPYESLDELRDEMESYEAAIQACEVDDYYEHGSRSVQPQFMCNHFDCTHGDWSTIDSIMHHGCELNQGFDIFGNHHADILYNCDTCLDHFREGVILCKRKPTIDRTRASRMLYRYLDNSKVHPLASDIIVQSAKFLHKRLNAYIKEELVAEAMHPNRIQKQLDHYENIEDFFEAIGC
ncbi:unnamed protein product [Phytophthora lilii]|uniref:Unnamed protein product n=1 Tax=Phytophthora lilii TaxID=2077276 RepID=A0A9W6U690_9STRA|nr:unnamed protein product [Phytophthora lilii]